MQNENMIMDTQIYPMNPSKFSNRAKWVTIISNAKNKSNEQAHLDFSAQHSAKK